MAERAERQARIAALGSMSEPSATSLGSPPRRGSFKPSFASSFRKESAGSDCLGRLPGEASEARRASLNSSAAARRASLTGELPMRERVTEDEAEGEDEFEFEDELEEEDDGTIDWAVECLMLTHEPIRCDLVAIERAAKRLARDNPPQEWRVKCFFRFFDDFCSLISQFFAVEISVHCDWLCAEGEAGEQLTSGHIVAADYRIELMRQHRELEELMLEVASLEGALMGGDTADVMGRKPVMSDATARTVSKMTSFRQGGQRTTSMAMTIRGPVASFRPGGATIQEGQSAQESVDPNPNPNPIPNPNPNPNPSPRPNPHPHPHPHLTSS